MFQVPTILYPLSKKQTIPRRRGLVVSVSVSARWMWLLRVPISICKWVSRSQCPQFYAVAASSTFVVHALCRSSAELQHLISKTRRSRWRLRVYSYPKARHRRRHGHGNRANVNSRAQSEQIAAGHIALLGSHLCRFCEQCISYCCLSTYSSAQYFLQCTLLLNSRVSLSCSLSFCSKLLIEHLSSIALLFNIIARAGNTFTSDDFVKSGAHRKTFGTAELRVATPRRTRLARQSARYSSGEGAALADMWRLDFDSSSSMLILVDYALLACYKHCRNVLILY